MRIRPALLAPLTMLSLIGVACGSGDASPPPPPTATPVSPVDDDEGTTQALLNEWSIELESSTLPAGDVTFSVRNIGAQAHEMTVVRTDLPPDELPMLDTIVDEKQLEVAGSTTVMLGGVTQTLTVTLPPGSYLLICNLPTHYDDGMYAPLTVE